MICFLAFCSMVIFSQEAPLYPGYLARYDAPAVVLIGHNTNMRDGVYFEQLDYGDVIEYEGREYTVTKIVSLQALTPASPRSWFMGERLMSPDEVWHRMYNQPGKIVLQTCIEKDGDPFWGRLFVIGE